MELIIVWLIIPLVCCAVSFLITRRNIKHIRWLAPLISLIVAIFSIPFWFRTVTFEANIYGPAGEIIGTYTRGAMAIFGVIFIYFPIQILLTFIFACIIYKIIKKRGQK